VVVPPQVEDLADDVYVGGPGAVLGAPGAVLEPLLPELVVAALPDVEALAVTP
jgi:hypothetical protein